ncbi:MAG: aldehyde dehydrogenase [Candidatus Eremiobacteraeota bacterium]|nr:aldehyde dehydrogenase [Candidatus Eremiobacteraeota bacterium]
MSATLESNMAEVSKLKLEGRAYIDGAYVEAKSGQTFSCISPCTGQSVAEIASCDEHDVDAAVRAARRSFEAGVWSGLAPRDRKKVLVKLAELIRQHNDELAMLETLDMGKPLNDSRNVDMPAVANCFAWFGEVIDKLYDEMAPVGPANIAMINREPVGVVGAVVPWNFPLLMAAWKLAPALAAGNSVVLKPAEQSPLTALRLAELAAEAGLPKGVLNVVPGLGEKAGKAIGLHPDIDCVGFTGSTEVGKLFMQYSGQSNLKRVWLECGGKSPVIVLGDCHDLDAAARSAAFGIFFNQGEVCNAGSRLLLHKSIKEPFLEKLQGWAKKLQPGDPFDPKCRMGAIVDKNQMNRVLGYIEKGQEQGAKLIQGGQQVRKESGGYFVEPTIFDGVRNDMIIAQEEIFGPVLSVLTFDEVDEAVKIANDTHYGLAAAVWTKDINLAHKTSRALRAGVVWVNCFDEGDMSTPFGGYKQSGSGRDKSIHALDKYVDLKMTWVKLY